MAFRFKRSVKLFPGLKMNIGKTGIGLSAGVKGAHIGVNKRGTYTNVGVPGTGASSLQYISTNKKSSPDVLYIQTKSNFSLFKIVLMILFFPFTILYFIFKAASKSTT